MCVGNSVVLNSRDIFACVNITWHIYLDLQIPVELFLTSKLNSRSIQDRRVKKLCILISFNQIVSLFRVHSKSSGEDMVFAQFLVNFDLVVLRELLLSLIIDYLKFVSTFIPHPK